MAAALQWVHPLPVTADPGADDSTQHRDQRCHVARASG
jgi:hypothetical protein